jgi:glycosyltransferase involved in cell wall biosynthesis
MTTHCPHISVCVCTYKRPELLAQLLNALAAQETDDLFSYSIVVADNDAARSAQRVVERFGQTSQLRTRYCVQPEQGISLTRNAAIANADGDFIAFVDDDEVPIQRWLVSLFRALQAYAADGVLGPVKPKFDERTPEWVVKGGFYDRPSYATGFVIDWKKGRTGNVLLKRAILGPAKQVFRKEFRSGEDQDLFRRLIGKGYFFVWCDEAVAFEAVPPIRWKRSFMLRRALLRGLSTAEHPTTGVREILTSIVAVPLYAMTLPCAFLFGQDKFMVLLVKLCDHLGRLLAVMGFNPVKEAYVTE